MGADYVPQNEASKINVSLIKDSTTPDAPAYEEDGHFVEGIVQPITTIYADLSGDPKPNADSLKTRFLSDNDWLREMTSQHDVTPANKTKLRYSDLFPNPVLEDKFEGTGAFKEKTEEEKAEIAADINKIFDEDEATKPKSHIIGNTIIILLIILILFIGSVLAAKLFAPDSEYAHVTDGIIEKVFDYFSKDDATEPTTNTDVDIDTTEKESDATYFQGVVSSLTKDITDMGEIVYQDDLKYSDIMEPAFGEVAGADRFIDEDWYEDESGTKVTYAEAIYSEVINYYVDWQQGNDDDNIAGISKLELGEIKNVGDNYYALVRVAYANKDGETETMTQTCYLTANDDNTMFLEEIKEETING